jgi:hypothetical protein
MGPWRSPGGKAKSWPRPRTWASEWARCYASGPMGHFFLFVVVNSRPRPRRPGAWHTHVRVGRRASFLSLGWLHAVNSEEI